MKALPLAPTGQRRSQHQGDILKYVDNRFPFAIRTYESPSFQTGQIQAFKEPGLSQGCEMPFVPDVRLGFMCVYSHVFDELTGHTGLCLYSWHFAPNTDAEKLKALPQTYTGR